MFKKIFAACIGPNKDYCSKELYSFGLELGKYLCLKNIVLINGAKFGFMEAVSKGYKEAKNYTFGHIIGILPESDKSLANEYIDINIPTGIGTARNSIIINSCDIVIAVGGGAGTLSEIAFAWQKNKAVFCCTQFGGWSEKLAGEQIDFRNINLLIPFKAIKDLDTLLANYL
jgi:uncharacterized protein (TIGR00725 family)